MSDPEDIPGRHVPPRADPIQPDRPGSGTSSETDSAQGEKASDAADAADPANRGDGERADAGLKNIREGYGGPSIDDHTDDPSMVPNRPATDAQ